MLRAYLAHRVHDVPICGTVLVGDIVQKKLIGSDGRAGGKIDVPQAMSIADLAVFRAGATGLAELTAKGIPAILIPYPYAAENHQEHNARAVEAGEKGV